MLLFAGLTILLAGRYAEAGGVTVDSRPGPGWGPQVDAAVLSPAAPEATRSPVERIQIWPWPPVQGQTMAVWVQARDAVTASVEFGGVLAAADLREGRGELLAPVGVLAEPGDTPMLIRTSAGTTRISVPVQAGTFSEYHIPQETGGGILSEAEKVRAETQRMTALFAGYETAGWTGRSRFRLPFDGALAPTAQFGQRRTYGNSPAVTAHAGQDYSAVPGTPVFAPASGTVALAEPLFVRGNAVVLDHGEGVFSGYWHLSELSVAAGQPVEQGQLIGKVGSTGLSTGAHLHWEMRVLGMAVDPVQWVAP